MSMDSDLDDAFPPEDYCPDCGRHYTKCKCEEPDQDQEPPTQEEIELMRLFFKGWELVDRV